ncbi:oligoendopeptidase F [candidate division KSB1 bacterium]|nr:oligoendopeptidase F [candidate division KSB1 bacterium]
MTRITGIILTLTLCTGLLMSVNDSQAQARERADVPQSDTWQLEDLYPDDAAWRASKDELVASMEQILEYQGKLATSPNDLLACLEFDSNLGKEFSKLYSYAGMKSDLDTRNADNMSMKQELQQLGTNYNSKASFIEPELVNLDKETIDKFIQKEPGLEVHRFYLNDILRRKAHKLSAEEEKIIAEAGAMAGGPSSIYNIFANAELPYPEVELSDGSKVTLNQSGYGLHRTSPNRDDRELVFKEFWGTMNQFRQTLGASMYSNIKGDIFYARVRGYDSSLHSKLDQNNIPVEVYHSLIKNVNDNLDSFHRYLKIKKRMLGVDTLKYSDLYAPTVKNVDLKYDYNEAKEMVLQAFKPLGKKYIQTVKNGLENRWVDVYPTPGKRSGAYSNGSAYDEHPYILLNYNGQYNDVSTLAHELGHTMHSYLSNKNQPYPLSDYSIFVAEVASTLNEALLQDYMMKKIKDDDVRLSLLMEYLDGIKGTLFRQTQFAEFELRMHELAEKDQPLTGDNLTELYADILKRYYGHEQGVTLIEDHVTVEWAFIPHFYYNFYVYQYATSFTASTALAEKVLAHEKGAVDHVMTFLSSGGSKYPIDILKDAGVDMTGSEPFDKTMQAMNRTMDEIEKILDKKGI